MELVHFSSLQTHTTEKIEDAYTLSMTQNYSLWLRLSLKSVESFFI